MEDVFYRPEAAHLSRGRLLGGDGPVSGTKMRICDQPSTFSLRRYSNNVFGLPAILWLNQHMTALLPKSLSDLQTVLAIDFHLSTSDLTTFK